MTLVIQRMLQQLTGGPVDNGVPYDAGPALKRAFQTGEFQISFGGPPALKYRKDNYLTHQFVYCELNVNFCISHPHPYANTVIRLLVQTFANHAKAWFQAPEQHRLDAVRYTETYDHVRMNALMTLHSYDTIRAFPMDEYNSADIWAGQMDEDPPLVAAASIMNSEDVAMFKEISALHTQNVAGFRTLEIRTQEIAALLATIASNNNLD
jgi:hypothetical protein